jgi:Cu+-exporting ATPase
MESESTEASGSAAVAIDPVCGMKVERALAAGAEQYEGRSYFFCSASCQQTFHAASAHYVGPHDDEGLGPERC